jgi:hypothetical protein
MAHVHHSAEERVSGQYFQVFQPGSGRINSKKNVAISIEVAT